MRALLVLAALAALAYHAIDWRSVRRSQELAYWKNALHGSATQAEAERAQRYIVTIERLQAAED
jgi:hypothetical protein